MEKRYDVIIIGAGIVGMATAYRLLEHSPGLRVCVIEKENKISAHQTGNNSGVIHSGVYYKPGGLRATNCIRGYKMLLEFCREEGIAHEVCGKIIVATEEYQLAQLQIIQERGIANGLEGIQRLSIHELREKEPYVNGLEGLFVPQAGIVDYPGMNQRMMEKSLEKGMDIFLNEKVVKVIKHSHGVEVSTENKSYVGSIMINCAGLYSDHIAAHTHDHLKMKILPFRGEYFKIKKEREYLVKHLIYPAPDPNFPWLGVHFTRMIHGGIEAGPNAVLAFKREDYIQTILRPTHMTI